LAVAVSVTLMVKTTSSAMATACDVDDTGDGVSGGEAMSQQMCAAVFDKEK
jgi:hypothetical protein